MILLDKRAKKCTHVVFYHQDTFYFKSLIKTILHLTFPQVLPTVMDTDTLKSLGINSVHYFKMALEFVTSYLTLTEVACSVDVLHGGHIDEP